MQANATQQMGLFGRIEQRWGIFRYTLSILSDLLGQCGKIGGNFNQLARRFNTGGRDSERLRAQLLTELSALTLFRLNAEKVISELYGNHQAYKLEEL